MDAPPPLCTKAPAMKKEPVSMASLPSELVARIIWPLGFHSWARLASTSHTFRAAASSLLAASQFIDLKNAGALLDGPCFASVISQLGSSLRRMELDCWHLDDSVATLIPSSVTELALCGADHHSDALLYVVACRFGCQLQRFAWSGFGGTVSEDGFLTLAQSCKGLTSFALDSGEALNPNLVVKAVASSCPNLVELSAYDLTRETLVHVKKCDIRLKVFKHKRRHSHGLPLTDVTLVLIAGMCPQLEELMLTDHTDGEGSGDVTDAGLLVLTERAATLRVLKLKLFMPQASRRCSAVAIMELVNACTKLTRLELCNLKRLADPPFYEIVQHCSGLIELCVDAAPITDTSLEFLVAHCPQLKSLSIKYCRKLTEYGLATLGQLSQLESLNAGQASGVTDISAAAICSKAASSPLTTLVLNYGQLSDSALSAIASCPRIQELALHNCPRITNKGLRAIAAGCPLLRCLSISACEYVSDAGVVAIASSCPRLLKIRLDGCRLLSNPSVRALCSPTLRLRYLSMQQCSKLSDGVFSYLTEAVALRFVDFARGNFTSGAIEAYHASRPLVELCIDGRPFQFCSPFTAKASPGSNFTARG